MYTDHQALKYVFNMRDPHGRIARCFRLLAEYDMEICCRACAQNAADDYFSRLINMIMVTEEADVEKDLQAVAHYLHSLSLGNQNKRFVKAIKLKAR